MKRERRQREKSGEVRGRRGKGEEISREDEKGEERREKK